MLDSFAPLAFVHRSVHPIHFSVPISLVVLVSALVFIPTCPLEHSLSVLFIVLVLTFVLVAVGLLTLLPLALAMLKPSFELPSVGGAVVPGVLTDSVGLSLYVGS